MFSLDSLNTLLQICVAAMTLVGAPIAVLTFFREWRLERQSRQDASYRRASDLYTQFLTLALAYPETEAYAFTADEKRLDIEGRRKAIMFDYTVHMIEDAYLAYVGSESEQRIRQWKGWHEYMNYFVGRRDFRDWMIGRIGPLDEAKPGCTLYDLEFERILLQELLQAEKLDDRTAPPVAPGAPPSPLSR